MSVNQSNLSSSAYGYGLVASTTQASINATMKAFLRTQAEPEVTLCYVFGDNGDPTLIDLATLQQRAKGTNPFNVPNTANPATDPDIQNLLGAKFMVGIKARIGLPPGYSPSAIPDIVGLSGGAASVSYNLMCSEFIVTQLTPPGYSAATWMNQSQPPGNAWIFNSRVDLQMTPSSEFSKLPPAVQAELQNLGSGFGVQQLLFDLDNAALESVPTIEGVQPGSSLYLVLQQYFLGAYMATLKQNGQPVLGCVITTSAPASPLELTALNFQVNPLLDSNGGPITDPTKDQLALTTLSYLCAADHSPLPNPARFTWNWVDPQNSINYDGAMAVNRGAFARYLWTALQGGVGPNCLAPTAKITKQSLGITFWPGFNPASIPAPTYPATGPTLLTLNQTATASDQAGWNNDIGAITLTSTFSLTVTCSGNQIVFVQHLTVYMYIRSLATGTSGNIVDRTITDTYSISVNDTGGLVGVLAKSESQDHSQNIDVGTFVNWFVDINGTIDGITKLARAVVALHLSDISLSTIQGFVFPGGNSFSFADGGFSEFQDLVAHITYVDPS